MTLIEMGNEENDESLIPEVESEFEEFKNRFDTLRVSTMLTGEYDMENAILTLHAGAGGTESCDWASMLSRMYQRWADKKEYKVEILDSLDGDEAGLKSITMQIEGPNAYGYLKSEHGVHRLVRISPFNAQGKRQTSFVSCDVMPDIEREIDIEIADDDIRIDTYRSSGAGGQHINKTSSAIRITHFPTGIVVQCQNERSQHMNKDKAMQMLKTKLLILKQQENLEKEQGIRGEVMENGFGSQIRSYVMQPYTMVKDLRTEAETGNVQAVMDGDIDMFMNAYLKWSRRRRCSAHSRIFLRGSETDYTECIVKKGNSLVLVLDPDKFLLPKQWDEMLVLMENIEKERIEEEKRRREELRRKKEEEKRKREEEMRAMAEAQNESRRRKAEAI